jgi:O-antigen ligase
MATSVSDYRISLVLIATPTAFTLLALKSTSRIYLIVLVMSLSFSARLRFGGVEFHQGGAEAAFAPLDFPLLGLVLLWLAAFFTHKQKKIMFRITGVGMAFLLLVLVHVLSVLVAYDSSLALLELIRLLKMGLVVLVVRHYVKTENDLRLVLSVLLGIMIVQGVLATVQTFFGTSLGLGFLGESDTILTGQQQGVVFGRAGGTLGHANALGYFYEMTLPIALGIFLWQGRSWLKTVSFCALGVGLFGAFLTYSRATWIAVLIGLGVVVVATTIMHKRHRARNFRYATMALLVIVIIGVVFRDSITQRVTLFGQNSWVFRLQTFELAVNMFQEHPLLGIGANNYLAAVNAYNYTGAASTAALTAPVHNILLLLAAETGLLGISAFAILLASIGFRAYHIAKKRADLITPSAIGIFAGIIALMAHSMLDWLFRYDPVYMLFWFDIGLLLAAGNILKRPVFQSVHENNSAARPIVYPPGRRQHWNGSSAEQLAD